MSCRPEHDCLPVSSPYPWPVALAAAAPPATADHAKRSARPEMPSFGRPLDPAEPKRNSIDGGSRDTRRSGREVPDRTGRLGRVTAPEPAAANPDPVPWPMNKQRPGGVQGEHMRRSKQPRQCPGTSQIRMTMKTCCSGGADTLKVLSARGAFALSARHTALSARAIRVRETPYKDANSTWDEPDAEAAYAAFVSNPVTGMSTIRIRAFFLIQEHATACDNTDGGLLGA